MTARSKVSEDLRATNANSQLSFNAEQEEENEGEEENDKDLEQEEGEGEEEEEEIDDSEGDENINESSFKGEKKQTAKPISLDLEWNSLLPRDAIVLGAILKVKETTRSVLGTQLPAFVSSSVTGFPSSSSLSSFRSLKLIHILRDLLW